LNASILNCSLVRADRAMWRSRLPFTNASGVRIQQAHAARLCSNKAIA